MVAGSFSANTQSLPNIYLPQEEWANFPKYLLDLPLPSCALRDILEHVRKVCSEETAKGHVKTKMTVYT